MGRNKETSGLIDGCLRFLLLGGTLAAGLAAPNIIQVLDKPVTKGLDKLDARAQQRELQRTLSYMRQQGLIRGDYEHGLALTDKGRRRLAKSEFANIAIDQPAVWDQHWRIVFYDIPEKHKQGRDALTAKLRQLGFYQLQRSVWVHPFPCRDVIETVTTTYKVSRYVTYVETAYIDKQSKLRKRFQKYNSSLD